jgi:hypothetical protein
LALATETINVKRRDLLPNNRLHVVAYDTCGRDMGAVIWGTWSLMQRQHSPGLATIKAIVGPNEYAENSQAIVRKHDGVVQLAPIGVENRLHDLSLYPTYARMEPPTIDQAPALIELIMRFGWKRVAVLADVGYSEFLQAFSSRCQSNGIVVETTQTYLSPDSSTTTTSVDIDVSSQIAFIRSTRTRIILLAVHQMHVQSVFRQLDEAHMIGHPFFLSGHE